MKHKLLLYVSAFIVVITSIIPFIDNARAELSSVRTIIFPVLGGGAYADDYGDPRSGGRTHEGNDIMGRKMTPLVSAVDGVVSAITSTAVTWGYSITIQDKDGYEYNYLHLNNDNPGTDDGLGGFNNAFAPGMRKGISVVAGQAIGFLGDSGNAESTGAHLHFEIRLAATNEPINPYQSLKAAQVIFQSVTNDGLVLGGIIPTPTPARPKSIGSPSPTLTPTPTPTPTKISSAIEFFPYANFEGGATIASGNFDSDSDAEIVTGTAFNGGGRTIINVFEKDGTLKNTFFAYGEVFRGGVDVAAADVDGDGKSEIITAAGPGGGPHIKVFKSDGTLLSEFMAYNAGFRGGVHVSAADVDGDGSVEIITGPGAGGGPHVRVFNKTGVLQKEWFAYSANFTGGVDVAAFAKESTTPGGYVTAPGAGGGPHIKVYNNAAQVTSEFMAYDGMYSSGVRIAASNSISAKSGVEIMTIPASNFTSTLKIFSTAGNLIKSVAGGFESTWANGYDVAGVGTDIYLSTAGGQKTSVRKVPGI